MTTGIASLSCFHLTQDDRHPAGDGGPEMPLGAHYLGDSTCSFNVWAPHCCDVSVVLETQPARELKLARSPDGYFSAIAANVLPGTRYLFRLDDKLRPDPASRFQPTTVHEASQIVDPAFDWDDHRWRGLPLRDLVIYELHVGTATTRGTFVALLPLLPFLKDLGVTAIELMPVAQFPGAHNWGYDGVYPFAVQNSYGGPLGLKHLLNAAHKLGLAVILDVVYNHLGPEGNYLRDFGPYFNTAHQTPWGDALNFDAAYSDNVRRFFLENALRWQEEFHLDGLRLDAIHAIRDLSAVPFLQDLADATAAAASRIGRPFHLIAESDLNDARVIRPQSSGGLGLQAQWGDDFHHCLHVLLTDEHNGYYQDFQGVTQFAKVLCEGYAYTGEYSRSRKRRHGNSPSGTSLSQFVVCCQNHDQIGNRFLGERLSSLVDFERLKLAAATVILSPFTPMLFMGEEYGETSPFLYFTSITDPQLVEAVRQGRRREFADFAQGDNMPDPFDADTVRRCFLDLALLESQPNSLLRNFYRKLISLRKSLPLIAQATRENIRVLPFEADKALTIRYQSGLDTAYLALNFSSRPANLTMDLHTGPWEILLNSTDKVWGGPGDHSSKNIVSEGRYLFEAPSYSATLLQPALG